MVAFLVGGFGGLAYQPSNATPRGLPQVRNPMRWHAECGVDGQESASQERDHGL